MRVLGKTFKKDTHDRWTWRGISITRLTSGKYHAGIDGHPDIAIWRNEDTPAAAIRALRKRAEEVVAALKEFEQ